eukprot:c19692_g1_i1.p1 GENE.c19692_g1_i1~~c19692_g1_i1.p1  ORF type:complete len:361 (-),score=114.03 c19692_g1_i1:21-1067(-)
MEQKKTGKALFHSKPNPLPGNAVRKGGLIPIPVQDKFVQYLEKIVLTSNDVRTEFQGNAAISGKAQIIEIIDPSLHADKKSRPPRWTPAVFFVDKKGKTKILSPINNLDIVDERLTYCLIARIFDRAIPLLEKSLQISLRSQNLQVIVKAQKYYFPENSDTYEGGVHKEGKFENILGVCLYYPKVQRVIGGDLCLGGPNFINGYTQTEENQMKRIPIIQGSMVAFNNTTAYHKVSKLFKSSKTIDGERIVFGFFLIDPKNKIPDSLNDVNVNLHLSWKRIVKEFAKNNGVETLPEDILKIIGSHFIVSVVKANKDRSEFKQLIGSNVVQKKKEIDYHREFRIHACNLD